MTEAPSSITYSSVVSRDSVRIAFTMAMLLDVDILSADVGNAYLNAPCREKIWVEAGMEFGTEWEGQVLIISWALFWFWCSLEVDVGKYYAGLRI